MTEKLKPADKRIQAMADAIRPGISINAEDKKFLFAEDTLANAAAAFNTERGEEAVQVDVGNFEAMHNFEADLESALVLAAGHVGVDGFKEHADVEKFTGSLPVGANTFNVSQLRDYTPRNPAYHAEKNPDVPERLTYQGRVDIKRDIPINNAAYKRSISTIYDYAAEILG